MNWRNLYLFVFCICSGLLGQAKPELNRELPAASRATLRYADAALKDQFTLQGVTGSPRTSDSFKYNWQHGGPKEDKEWAWFLNRHRYFEDLYLAYSTTSDARYANKLFAILADWLEEYENAPSGMSFSTAWRPLEAARRILESWDLVYVKLWDDPNFPADLKPKFLSALENHGDYLQSHHALYGNHLITEMLALLKLSLLIPKATNSETWQHYALQKLETEHQRQFYTSGAHKELSSHYQRVVLLNFQQLLTLLESAQKDQLLQIWKPRVEAMWDYFRLIQKPNGLAPLNNDSDQENIAQLLVQNGRTPSPPQTSKYFTDAGHVVFRAPTSDEQLLWAFFDIGPGGTDHQHEDFLHLSLSLGEEDLLVDTGRYTYQPGIWREYFKGSRGHNVLLIDEQESVQKPKASKGPLLGSGYTRTDHYQAAWGATAFQNKMGVEIAQWQRSVVLLPEIGLLILDHLITFKNRHINGFWHAAPTAEWQTDTLSLKLSSGKKSTSVSHVNSQSTTIDRSIQSGKSTPYIQGWHSPSFNNKSAIQTLNYKISISQPTVLAWLFSPQSYNCQLISIQQSHSQYQLNYQHNGIEETLTIELPNRNSPLKVLR